MTYIIKRKFRGALGGDVDGADMSALLQHIQTSGGGNPAGVSLDLDTLTVNNLIVKLTNKIPVGTDKYR